MDPTTFATAYTLSASIGIRPFLTLAFASLAMHFGYLHPSPAFAFLHSDGATVLLGALAVLEFAGDKIPVLDHALHVVHFATKPIAAAVLVGSTVQGAGAPDLTSYAMMGVGALTATGVHTGIASLRGASSATTMGIGNPILSVLEDVATVIASVLAILLPFVGLAIALAFSIVLLLVARRIYLAMRRSQTTASAGA